MNLGGGQKYSTHNTYVLGQKLYKIFSYPKNNPHYIAISMLILQIEAETQER